MSCCCKTRDPGPTTRDPGEAMSAVRGICPRPAAAKSWKDVLFAGRADPGLGPGETQHAHARMSGFTRMKSGFGQPCVLLLPRSRCTHEARA
jgi:hypothetical protein